MKIKIVHLYPELLNLYGDKGNIECLKHRLLWRNIEAEVTECNNPEDFDISDADIVYLGGGSDREEIQVAEYLGKNRDALKEYVENGGVMVATCGGFPMTGKKYCIGEETVDAIGILDIETVQAKDRFISDTVLETEFGKVIGFVNHGSRTDIGNYTPFGKVLYGNGNTDNSDAEGVRYKNLFATYLHGPLFPKNPKLCDYVLAKALEKKYPEFDGLSDLDDTAENTANEYMINRFLK